MYDVVFDERTFKTTKNIRASIYTMVYISKDRKSILIAKPQTHILSKLIHPNSKIAKPDIEYTRANLHSKFVCRDIRRFNFICHAENTHMAVFENDWKSLKMEEYLDKIMKN